MNLPHIYPSLTLGFAIASDSLMISFIIKPTNTPVGRMINGEGEVFNAKEAGVLKTKS
jgi:hypothetical protein